MSSERKTYDIVRNDGKTIRVNKEEFDADRPAAPIRERSSEVSPAQTETALAAMGLDAEQVAKFIAFAKTL